MRDLSEYRSERDRANILLMLMRSGPSRRGVARATGHAPSHVNATVARFREDGVQGLTERRGGNNRLPRRDEIMALLPRLTAGCPGDYGWNRSTWSVELIVLEVERQVGVNVSRPHMGRMLKEAKCRRICVSGARTPSVIAHRRDAEWAREDGANSSTGIAAAGAHARRGGRARRRVGACRAGTGCGPSACGTARGTGPWASGARLG